jgi:hypothetical protein
VDEFRVTYGRALYLAPGFSLPQAADYYSPEPTAPDAPIMTGSLCGQGSADLGWQRPAWDGDSPIVSYEIEWYTNGDTVPVGSKVTYSTACSDTIDNLAANPTVFRVAAWNDIGRGPWSEYSDSCTPDQIDDGGGGGGGGGGGTPASYECATYGWGDDGHFFVKNFVGANGVFGLDPDSISHDERVGKGPLLLVLGGFANSGMNGSVEVSWAQSYMNSNVIGWTGTLGSYSVTCSLQKGSGYYSGAEWSTPPFFYGISQPHGYNQGTAVTAWIITLALPSPPYPDNWDDWEAVMAYFDWQYQPHPEARIVMPVVYFYNGATLKISRNQQMLALAGVRSSSVYDSGPRLNSSIDNYTEPLLATSQDIADNQAGFLYAIKETQVVSGSPVYYWDQSADVAGARSCGGPGGSYDWGNGVAGVSSIGTASRYARLTLPHRACGD